MRNKTELYNNEQHEVIEEIISILKLDDNHSCTLYGLDIDIDKQIELMKLIPKVRKFFSFSRIIGVSEPHKAKRPWLGLIKQIVTYEYNITVLRFKFKEDGKLIRTQKYVFSKK